MALFFSSDLHFGHSNIIIYSGRPYTVPGGPEGTLPDPEAMNLGIIERWNATVRPEDDVLVLGDVAMGRIAESLPLVGLLNGHLRLRPGNHDRCWRGNRKGVDRWRGEYLDAGFEEILDDPDPLTVAGRKVLLNHFPYNCERFPTWAPVDRGEWLFCGHVHEAWRQRGRQINVGLDAWAGRPVSLDTLTGLVEAGPQNLEPLEWAFAA